MQAYDQRQTQATLDNYLTFSQRFAKIKSKRLQKAVSAIRGSKNEEILLLEEGGPPRKRPKNGKAATAATPEPGNGVTMHRTAGGIEMQQMPRMV